MINDSPEGQTHSYGDGCGEPEHNFPSKVTNTVPPIETDGGEGMRWRKNLHNTIKYSLNYAATKDDTIPQVIIDAIDAAYIQGLEDTKAHFSLLQSQVLERVEKEMDFPDGGDEDLIGEKKGLAKAKEIIQQVFKL